MNRQQAHAALVDRSGGIYASHIYERMLDLATFMPHVTITLNTPTPLHIVWDESEYTLPPASRDGLRLEVTEGEVRLDAIETVLDMPDVLILEASVSSDTAPPVTFSNSRHTGVDLFVLHPGGLSNDTARATRIVLGRRHQGWRVFCSASRYQVRICAYSPRLARTLSYPVR